VLEQFKIVMTMSKKTATVKIENVTYTIRKFKFGDNNILRDHQIALDELGRSLLLSGTQRHLTLKLGLEPPLTDKQIENLDEKVGDKLYKAIMSLNPRRPLVLSPPSSSPQKAT